MLLQLFQIYTACAFPVIYRLLHALILSDSPEAFAAALAMAFPESAKSICSWSTSGLLLSVLASASALAVLLRLLGLLGLGKRGVNCWMLLIASLYAEAMLLAEADAGEPLIATELASAGDPLVEVELATAGPPFVATDLLLAGDPLVPIALEIAGAPFVVATLDTAGAPLDFMTVWGVEDTAGFGLGDGTAGRVSGGRGEGPD